MRMPFQPPFASALRALAAAMLALAAGAAVPAVTPSALAPDFTLRTMGGPNLRLHEQRGHVVLVNFWASWCGPCRQEMPHLNRLYEKYRSSGFQLLGVNIDEDARVATELAAKLGVKFPVLLDSEKKVSRLYDMSAMPATIVIDRDGRVRYIHRGFRDGVEKTYEQQIRELLKE
ncbi:glutathione peroxidase [Burkholderiaceae bacterium]|nr:glutathione peroxidase [Burkholderiaceae bacterium]